MIDDEQRRRHARASLRLVAMTTACLCALALIIPLVAPALSGYSFLRFPLGLFIAVQGTTGGIIALIFWAAARQDRLDRRHGLTSEF
jgi:putative solute:sodium symporter small subunit